MFWTRRDLKASCDQPGCLWFLKAPPFLDDPEKTKNPKKKHTWVE